MYNKFIVLMDIVFYLQPLCSYTIVILIVVIQLMFDFVCWHCHDILYTDSCKKYSYFSALCSLTISQMYYCEEKNFARNYSGTLKPLQLLVLSGVV